MWIGRAMDAPGARMTGYMQPDRVHGIPERYVQREDRHPADYIAEWEWDGIRVQVAASGGIKRLYSRAGEDVSAAFPDIIGAIDFDGAAPSLRRHIEDVSCVALAGDCLD